MVSLLLVFVMRYRLYRSFKK